MEKKCIQCGKFPTHNRNDCPAIYVPCRQCSKIGHYAKVCKNKSEVRELKEDDFLGSITLDKIYSVKGVEGLEWQAKIKVTTKVCCKIINFRLDTGVDVTVILNRLFRKNSPVVWDMNKKLYGPGHKEIQVIRHVEAMLDNGRISSQQDLYVVKNLDEPLLGEPAIKALKILGKIIAINNESHQYSKDFPRVFKGLGKLKNIYKIHLDETAQLFTIATPRRLPLPMKQKVQEELKCLEKENIIRPVKMPTDWCAPIVTVLKNNGKVRLCVDFTKLNESVKSKISTTFCRLTIS